MTALFLESQHPSSRRTAVVDSAESSVWLYLTGPDGEKPIADCFLFNTGGPWSPGDDGPPPLDPKFSSDVSIDLPVSAEEVEIKWSESGNDVAIVLRGETLAFITASDLRGYSRAVRVDCPWAHAFSLEMFRPTFPGA